MKHKNSCDGEDCIKEVMHWLVKISSGLQTGHKDEGSYNER